MIQEWINFTCKRCDAEYLADTPFFFRNLKIGVLGEAFLYLDFDYIVLNAFYWNDLKQSVKREIVIHEMCHIIDFWENDSITHSESWERLMIKCGLQPDYQININPPDVSCFAPPKYWKKRA